MCSGSSSSDSSNLEGGAITVKSSIVLLLDVQKAPRLSKLNGKRNGERQKTASATNQNQKFLPAMHAGNQKPAMHAGKPKVLPCNACREEVSFKAVA